MKATISLAFTFLVTGCMAFLLGNPAAAQDARPRIAVIPKGTTHVFWKSVEAGARKAAEEAGAEVIWKGPLQEDDRAQQIQIVEQFVSEGVSAIVLAPLDKTALKRPVESAMKKGIPVIIIDSALDGEPGTDYVSLIATDNRKAGSIGGDHLAKLLGGTGDVVLLRYQEGSASTMEREAGFLDAVKQHAGIKILVDNRYGGATAGEAQKASMELLDRIREAEGIFTPNESTTFGMLLALRQANLAGKVRFVGFDTSPKLIEGLRKNEIHGLVAQNPTRMGYLGVQSAIAKLKGEPVPPMIDTGALLITQENLTSPEVREVLGR